MLPTSFNYHNAFQELTGPYEAMRNFFTACHSFNDRTELTKNIIPMTNDSPLDFIKPKHIQTFAELCDARGVNLLALNKQIEVYWSGGIDSTAVVVSLLKAGGKKQLVIRCTEESKEEYPDFYKKLQTMNIVTKNIDFNASGELASIITTGELADQLFGGSFAMVKMPYVDDVFVSYQDVTPALIVDYVSPVIQAYPRPVKTLVDFIGLLNLVYKWQSVKDRWIIRFGGLDRTRLVHFFDTPEFQSWSLFTNELKVHPHTQKEDVLKSHKAVIRDYIFEYTKDTVYRDTKIKHGSNYTFASGYSACIARVTTWKYVMEDGSVIYNPELDK